jgi:hypothetical protein
MRYASIAAGVLPITLGLVAACRSEPNPVALKLQGMSFANSEWSEPVNLGAPVNSAANEMNAALSPDERSLYFVSTRAGGLGGADIWVSRRASLDAPWGESSPPIVRCHDTRARSSTFSANPPGLARGL